MEWTQTINSTQSNWSDRLNPIHSHRPARPESRTKTSSSWPTKPTRICGSTSQPWPPPITSRKMSQLIHSKLDPGLKVYVEYSNETWNWLAFDEYSQVLTRPSSQSTREPREATSYVVGPANGLQDQSSSATFSRPSFGAEAAQSCRSFAGVDGARIQHRSNYSSSSRITGIPVKSIYALAVALH